MKKTILRPFFLTLLLSVSGLLFSQVPQGAINGLFLVSANQQVLFSKGNLQYICSASTPYWKFAEHQWEYLGNNGQGSTDQNVNRDLFGWGTSGYNHGAVCYQPWSTSQHDTDYWAYNDYQATLNSQSGQADWAYNAILNGGNQENSGWRTLRKDEWDYVFKYRPTASGIRYAKAKVNGVNGVILLPDDWSTSYYSLNNTNQGNASFDSNIISASQWSTLEQHDAVFLPADGNRYGTSVELVGYTGQYWSASYNKELNDVCLMFFSGSYLDPQGYGNPLYGRSVRLVRSAQGVTDVDELSAEDFTLYPNPADNILVIEGPSEINSCEIYNLTGLLVYKAVNGEQRLEVNTSGWASGAYLVKVVAEGKVFTRKFVKK